MRRHSRIPKVYSSRSYQNPFFNRRRKKIRRIPLKTKLIIATFILVLGGLIWALLFNAYFLIDNVIVKGANHIDDNKIYSIIDQQLKKKRLLFFNQNNIFIFSKNQAKKAILNDFNVNSLNINKNLPNTLIISFTEKTPAAVWLENENYYYIDSSFNILSQVDALSVDATDFIILKNEFAEQEYEPLIRQNGEVRTISLDEKYLLFSLQISKLTQQTGINIDNIFTINDQENTVRMQMINGPQIYLNIDKTPTEQINALKILLSEKLNDKEVKNLQYIDLRFGDKKFYK